MARGKTKKLPVDQGEIRKLMAQMQKCLVGKTLPKVGVLDDFEMMQEGTMKDLIEDIKTQHKKVWEAYHGENHQTILHINALMDKIGNTLRELRAKTPEKVVDKREYFTKHAMINHDEIEDIVLHLKRERTKYVEMTQKVKNVDGKERTTDFVNKKFPHFNIPHFMKEGQEYDIRKLMSWLRNTKRKAFAIYYVHIEFNTLKTSKFERSSQHHGRTQRSNEMEAYVEHYNKAHKAIIELRRMRHPRNPKKAKKSRKERRNHENKKKQHVNPPHKMPIHGGSRLTAFPDLDDYGF